MTNQDIIDTIEGQLGWVRSRTHRENAERILDALRQAGCAIVQLPEPRSGPDGEGEYVWATTVAMVSTGNSQVWEEDCEMDPDWARELAAALLAAADKAEGGK